MKFEHYRIRLLEKEDLDSYYKLVEDNRQRLEDFFTGTVSRTKTFDDTKHFLDEMIQRRENRTYFPFIIEDLESKALIGFLDIKNVDWNIPKAELGCYTDNNYSGKGITSKAFSLFVDYCFETYGFQKLFLRTHKSNFSAQKLAEGKGFIIEGTIRCEYKTTKGELVDLIYFGKLAQDK